MAYNTGISIIIDEGLLMHIPCIRVHHRNHPEMRGEGCCLADAIKHLTCQLTLALESAPSRRRREAFRRALNEVREFGSARKSRVPRPMTANSRI